MPQDRGYQVSASVGCTSFGAAGDLKHLSYQHHQRHLNVPASISVHNLSAWSSIQHLLLVPAFSLHKNEIFRIFTYRLFLQVQLWIYYVIQLENSTAPRQDQPEAVKGRRPWQGTANWLFDITTSCEISGPKSWQVIKAELASSRKQSFICSLSCFFSKLWQAALEKNLFANLRTSIWLYDHSRTIPQIKQTFDTAILW